MIQDRTVCLCSVHDGEILGDAELVHNLSTYMQTVVCTTNTQVRCWRLLGLLSVPPIHRSGVDAFLTGLLSVPPMHRSGVDAFLTGLLSVPPMHRPGVAVCWCVGEIADYCLYRQYTGQVLTCVDMGGGGGGWLTAVCTASTQVGCWHVRGCVVSIVFVLPIHRSVVDVVLTGLSSAPPIHRSVVDANSKHWFTTFFLQRKVPEREAWSVVMRSAGRRDSWRSLRICLSVIYTRTTFRHVWIIPYSLIQRFCCCSETAALNRAKCRILSNCLNLKANTLIKPQNSCKNCKDWLQAENVYTGCFLPAL